MLGLFACLLTILLQSVTCHSLFRDSPESLSEAERQDLLNYASRLANMASHNDVYRHPGYQIAQKRNPGMLETILQMPDIMGHGRK